MYTISNILQDVDQGIMAHNMIEDKFSYRIIFFVNEGDRSYKRYIDTAYDGLRTVLEKIVKENLTTTNCVVVAQTTTLKDGKCVSLLSRAYPFSLNEYFRKLCEEKEYISDNYRRRRANWC